MVDFCGVEPAVVVGVDEGWGGDEDGVAPWFGDEKGTVRCDSEGLGRTERGFEMAAGVVVVVEPLA